MNDTLDESASSHEAGADARGAQTGAELPPPYVSPGAVPSEPRPPLRRSKTERIAGGVAGGLGRTFGVDPVVFRVIFAVLTVIGGSGLLLYLLFWLLLPEEGSDSSSLADRWVRSRDWSTVTVVLLALVGAVLVSLVFGLNPGPLVLLAILVVVALVVMRPRPRREPTAFATGYAQNYPTQNYPTRRPTPRRPTPRRPTPRPAFRRRPPPRTSRQGSSTRRRRMRPTQPSPTPPSPTPPSRTGPAVRRRRPQRRRPPHLAHRRLRRRRSLGNGRCWVS